MEGGGYIGFGLSVIPSIHRFVCPSVIICLYGGGGGLYRIWVVCHSLHSSVCSSIRHNFFVSAQYLQNFFYKIYQNFVYALILTLSSLGLLHIIFPKFVPELWSFIYAKISFPLNILRTTRHIFTKFIYALILTRSSLGYFVTGHFFEIGTRVMALYLLRNFVSDQYLENHLVEFHQILYMHSSWQDLAWDCYRPFFAHLYQRYGP